VDESRFPAVRNSELELRAFVVPNPDRLITQSIMVSPVRGRPLEQMFITCDARARKGRRAAA
jgi:hypothetical protein